MTTDTSLKLIKRDVGASRVEFAITNYTEDVAMNCDTAAVAETNDVLATVIRELINQGILNGSVATA
jgi:hypothetical protein